MVEYTEDDARLAVAYGIVEAIRRARGSRVGLTVADVLAYARAHVPTAGVAYERFRRGGRPVLFWLVRDYLNLLARRGLVTTWPRKRNTLYMVERGSKLWELARGDSREAVEYILHVLGGAPALPGRGKLVNQ